MTKVNRAVSIFTFCLLTVCALQSKAQTACTQTLRQARTVFDEGRIHEIEGLLAGCIKNGFNDEERTEAYRLLILSYIYLDETEKADNAMLALLKDNHGFSINQLADPTELINLYQTFRTKPTFFWGIRGGINTTFVNVINAYGIHDQNNTNAKYTNKIGIAIGLLAEKNFGERLTLRSDIQYITNSFDFKYGFFEKTTDGSKIINSTVTEAQTSLGLSLMAQYRLFQPKEDNRKSKIEKLNPYVGIGVTGRSLLSSNLTFDVSNSVGSSPDGPSEDLIGPEIRKKFNPTADVEIGIKKSAKLNYITLGLRYSYGFLNITDRNYDNGRLTTYFGYAANDINTHSITLFLGILIPNYSPKKLNK
ncbi:MAG TPA: porin family protein [Fulvivirga sp.]|nr:porin family protein [Fulvivirga sp.]